MSVSPLTVLRTFPVTQQVVGIGELVIGIVKAVVNLASKIFHEIRYKHAIRNPVDWQPLDAETTQRCETFRMNGINRQIEEAEEGLVVARNYIKSGILTAIPVVGTIIHAKEWYRATHSEYIYL